MPFYTEKFNEQNITKSFRLIDTLKSEHIDNNLKDATNTNGENLIYTT